MSNKTISNFLLTVVLISLLCAGTHSDQSAISDSVNSGSDGSANDTAASENAFEENSPRGDTLTSDVKPGPANASKRFSPAAEPEASSKPQKIKKKVLISNLKSATEKAVLPNDKYDKQSHLRTSLNGSASNEDEIKSKPSVKVEIALKDAAVGGDEEIEPAAEESNGTAAGGVKPGGNGTSPDDSFRRDAFESESEKDLGFVPNEPRNFEISDRKKKNNSNFKISNRKNKVTTSTTENYGNKGTTNSYIYFTLQEVQKAVNSNYLNVNEDFEKNSQTLLVTSNTPVLRATEALPRGRPDSISNGNTVKNLVRLENNYYGPTDQTDWIPVVPIKRLESEKQLENDSALSKSVDSNGNAMLTTTIKPAYPSLIQNARAITRKKHSTTESNILIPSSPLTLPPSSVPPREGHEVQVAEDVPSANEPGTTETMLDAETDGSDKSNGTEVSSSGSNSGASGKGQNPGKQPGAMNKFRGTTKYRPLAYGTPDPMNWTAENGSNPKGDPTSSGNVTGDVLRRIEVASPSGVDENGAAPEGTSPPDGVGDSDALAFGKKLVSTAVNFASKSANETLPATLDVAKPKNIAKIQVLKNTISDKFASDNPASIFKFSETEPPNSTTSTGEGSTAKNSVRYPSTTEAPGSAVDYGSAKLSSASNGSGAAMEMTTQTPVHEFAVGGSDPTRDSGDGAQEDDGEIEYSLSRDAPGVVAASTRAAGTSTLGDVNPTTVSGEGTEIVATTSGGSEETTATKEESTTALSSVTETERDNPYTDETMPKTTFGSVALPDSDADAETESSVDETQRQPGTANVEADVSAAAAEKDGNAIANAEADDEKASQTGTGRRAEDEEMAAGSRTVRPGVRREITEENVPAYLKLTVEAASWEELCRLKDDLRNAIIHMLDGMNITSDSVVFLNLNDRSCRGKMEEPKDDRSSLPMFLPVNMFLMNENGDFDKNLSEAFLNLWGQYGLDFELPIRKVDFLTPLGGLYDIPNDTIGVSVIAAIIISCVAGLCVILLGILFVIMKRRQKRFNYGQRCTPVSLDAYSLDSVSIHNSVRRKGIRTSKRSYGNAAFDDPEVPSHPMNFAGLANFSSDKEQLHEEFNIIPQVSPKTDELPAGAERKNRYANVIPLPETRVYLSVKDGDNLSDYINANYVRGLKGAEKLYIACQAPMESTVEDFWRMIWEQQSKVVMMLTNLQENGKEKCTDYLPPNEVTDNLRLFGDYQITLKKRDVKEKYIISHLKLKNMDTNLWREVTHLWYLGWPDQGVPSEGNSLIAFLIEARSQMKSQTGSAVPGPVVIHCSPGTGRTGTVIACDLCIREYEQTRMVDIPKCVFNLRKDRAGSVQTKDQYAFIYQVLNLYATKLTGGGLESI